VALDSRSTRSGRGRNYCFNIGEILIDRADAYRLHKREKEASNYLRRSHKRLPGKHLARSGLLLVLEADRLREGGFRQFATLTPSSCVGVRLLIPQTSSLRTPRKRRVTLVLPLVARQTTPSSLPVYPLGRPSYRNLLVPIFETFEWRTVCLFQCAVQLSVSHSLSTRHAASISSILKNTNQIPPLTSFALSEEKKQRPKGLQSINRVVSLRRSTPHLISFPQP
jgi:hypothetical protein